uniref:NB-ARC domain-containing protein n=1 Tax=Fagus sylvatica TaxID=28930 RepID=A0A2N9G466_FAGSY
MTSREVIDFFSQTKMNNEPLRKLKTALLLINAVLNDAEEKQITSPAVKEWVNELKDAAYHAQDLVDEVVTDASRYNYLEAGLKISPNKASNLMESKLEEILHRLEFLAKQRDLLGLKEGGGGERPSQKLPTTSFVEESETTLAQLVYNNKMVIQNFDVRAWVCVSQEFDVLRITKSVLEAITSSTSDSDDLDLLQVRLNKSLLGRKFLIVLDDVWNENYLDWEDLLTPLKSGAYGKESGAYPELERIGKNIVIKCNGLPLAAKTLGGLLRLKFDPKEWVKVLESNIWNFSDRESNILPALRLSYHYLPSQLKPCFAYCSIFPKKFKFKKEELVRLWMAEDFLLHPRREDLEEVGIEYFNDLVSRSFFQRMEGDNPYDLSEKARYFSYSRMKFDAYEKFEAFHGAKSLRTFLPSNVLVQSGCLSNKVILDLVPALRSLRLENVVDSRDALEANMREKLQLNELVLKWGGDTDDSKKDRDVLDQLQPHADLTKLTIENYGGTTFSDWLGHPSNNIVFVQIHNSASGNKPFGSLGTLRFKNMLQLQEWLPFTDDNGDSVAFPRLHQLCIENCPNLTKGLPDGLFSLKALVIDKCQMLVASLTSAPANPSIEVTILSKGTCQHPTSACFRVDNCINLKALPEQMHTLLPSLGTLSICFCPELESFPDGGLPSSLNSLEIFFCEKLIARRRGWGLQGLPSLRSFCIRGKCENGESFPERALLPSSLTSLEIWNNPLLKSLDANELQNLTALKKLGIGCCPNLQSIARRGFSCLIIYMECKRWNKPTHVMKNLVSVFYLVETWDRHAREANERFIDIQGLGKSLLVILLLRIYGRLTQQQNNKECDAHVDLLPAA